MPDDALTARAADLTTQAGEARIADQSGYDNAVRLLSAVKALRVEAENHHRPMIKAARAAWLACLDALKRIDGPLETAENKLKAKIAAWDAEQARILAKAHRAALEEAQRQAEEAAIHEALIAEQSGAGERELAALLDSVTAQPLVPAPVEEPYKKAPNVAVRVSLDVEVVDIAALISHIAGRPDMVGMLLPNMSALRAYVRACGASIVIPGVRVVMKRSVAVKGSNQ